MGYLSEHSLQIISSFDAIISATSRCILVLFEWYGCLFLMVQYSCNTFSIYIFHVKTKWNIVYENLKTKIFSRDLNILPQMQWTLNIFGSSATTIGGFWVSQAVVFPSTLSCHSFCVPNWGCKKLKAFFHAEDIKKSAGGL